MPDTLPEVVGGLEKFRKLAKNTASAFALLTTACASQARAPESPIIFATEPLVAQVVPTEAPTSFPTEESDHAHKRTVPYSHRSSDLRRTSVGSDDDAAGAVLAGKP